MSSDSSRLDSCQYVYNWVRPHCTRHDHQVMIGLVSNDVAAQIASTKLLDPLIVDISGA